MLPINAYSADHCPAPPDRILKTVLGRFGRAERFSWRAYKNYLLWVKWPAQASWTNWAHTWSYANWCIWITGQYISSFTRLYLEGGMNFYTRTRTNQWVDQWLPGIFPKLSILTISCGKIPDNHFQPKMPRRTVNLSLLWSCISHQLLVKLKDIWKKQIIPGISRLWSFKKNLSSNYNWVVSQGTIFIQGTQIHNLIPS